MRPQHDITRFTVSSGRKMLQAAAAGGYVGVGAKLKTWFGVGVDAVLEGWEPEAAAARPFDEAGARSTL